MAQLIWLYPPDSGARPGIKHRWLKKSALNISIWMVPLNKLRLRFFLFFCVPLLVDIMQRHVVLLLCFALSFLLYYKGLISKQCMLNRSFAKTSAVFPSLSFPFFFPSCLSHWILHHLLMAPWSLRWQQLLAMWLETSCHYNWCVFILSTSLKPDQN